MVWRPSQQLAVPDFRHEASKLQQARAERRLGQEQAALDARANLGEELGANRLPPNAEALLEAGRADERDSGVIQGRCGEAGGLERLGWPEYREELLSKRCRTL